ncbi:hypothetical protein [Anaeromyxobacter oryzae]|uniref:Uncharacterized protein n=1 Tax=Anaeromyxobacter oryzae TaxID=2918170 RepID=A0ABN6N0Z0_9BACT|nr:hypothetical protein [Anaeromyxobacter oryzae]BDG05579.1 hypothetical protein AMOR_45750 [Anaeromyxobacter oryzae]
MATKKNVRNGSFIAGAPAPRPLTDEELSTASGARGKSRPDPVKYLTYTMTNAFVSSLP